MFNETCPQNVRPLILEEVTEVTGLHAGSEEVMIHFANGYCIRLYHMQDCCESVSLNDFEVFEELKGPLLTFDETSNSSNDGEGESETWTFYNIRIGAGVLNLRWLGESNGYYSEAIDVEVIEPQK